jgi:chemotaxis protein MotB
MARRHQHEEHQNHEAWAIPYGDLVTLLLAFFVVMYAISSVNEGKYRAVSDALSSAFGGPPRSISPINIGQTQLRGAAFDRPSLATPGTRAGPSAARPVNVVPVRQMLDVPRIGQASAAQAAEAAAAAESARGEAELASLGRQIQDALSELVRQKLVTVRRGRTFLEVEIQSDILFASGVAAPSPVAMATVRKLASVLRAAPNAVRVEGYTDDRPIRTAQFPSNWELSSARAASVVHVLVSEGVGAERLAVVGFGEHQPIADNATVDGRNANRRVLLVILASPQQPDAVPETGAMIASAPAAAMPESSATGTTTTTSDDARATPAAPTSHATAVGAPRPPTGAATTEAG